MKRKPTMRGVSNYWESLLEKKMNEMIPETVKTIRTIVPNGNDTTVVTTTRFVESQLHESTETVVKKSAKTCKTNHTIQTITRSVGGRFPQVINLSFVKFTNEEKNGTRMDLCRHEGCEVKAYTGGICRYHANGAPTQKKACKWLPEMEDELLRMAKRHRITEGSNKGRTDWNALWENATVLQEAGYTLQQCRDKYLQLNSKGNNTRFLK